MAEELELAMKLRDGQRAAFDLFFDRYADAVFSLMRRRTNPVTARTLTTRTLETALEGIGGFDGNTSLDQWVLDCCNRTLAAHFAPPASEARASIAP